LNFQNPRWRTAAILKTVKSPYLRNRLTDFDEIWHDDADWPPTGDTPLKFRIFQKKRWRRSSYHNNQLADLHEAVMRLCKIGLLTVLAIKKFELPKSKMADGRQYENR